MRELESVAYNIVIAEDHERKEKGATLQGHGDSIHSLSTDSHHTNHLLRSHGNDRVSGLDFDDNYDDDE